MLCPPSGTSCYGLKHVIPDRLLLVNASSPIFLVVDGHPTHKAKSVKRFVQEQNGWLELHYLPAYAPELNPDELVWNDLKNNALGRKFITSREALSRTHDIPPASNAETSGVNPKLLSRSCNTIRCLVMATISGRLISRRRLLIPIHTISFAPAAELRHVRSADYPLANADSIVAALTEFNWAEADINVFNYALSVVENVSTVGRSLTKRTATRSDSRAAKLEKLEHSIATLDHRQNRAVIETVEGAQRIRGLAGSGKTIALALKAAYLHAQFPQWKIAVTFNTRSLKGLYERLIQDFHAEQTGLSPDWQKIRIVNSWGAPGAPERDGLYHEFCRTHGLEYLDFGAAKARFRRGESSTVHANTHWNRPTHPRPAYDVGFWLTKHRIFLRRFCGSVMPS